MAMATGMTSAIMNPVAVAVTQTKIAEKKAELAAQGIVIPDSIDDETFVTLMGMGSTRPRAGSEMAAIRAANFLTNNDPSGAEWIRFNRPPVAEGEGRGRTGRRARR
jgi:5-methyltetrahydrofolate--homocysteine methyltransferase